MNTIDDQEGQPFKGKLSGCRLSAWTANKRELLQSPDGSMDFERRLPRTRTPEMISGVIADIDEILESGFRPANPHQCCG
jgi:hypothetical protein